MTSVNTTISHQQQHHQPWVERYRPKNLESVSHQKEVVATLQNAVSSGNLPHLLFYGPPGSGKVRTLTNSVLLFTITIYIIPTQCM
jgi:replication factor C subunit 2/4